MANHSTDMMKKTRDVIYSHSETTFVNSWLSVNGFYFNFTAKMFMAMKTPTNQSGLVG